MEHESNIDWTFDAGWVAVKYDAWTYYRKHFQPCADSAAVDFIVVSDDGKACWLLEVKDFTTSPPDPQKGPLWDIVTRKVRDSLAGLLAAATRASGDEQAMARRVVSASQVRVAFHCEGPTHPSRLFKGLPSAADLRQKLRSRGGLRAVDTKVLVMDCATTPTDVPWKAAWNPKGEVAQ